VIVHMTRLRIAGPRDRLDATLLFLQDEEAVHVAEVVAPTSGLVRVEDDETRLLRRVLGDVEGALRALEDHGAERAPHPEAATDLARGALHAGRVRRRADRLALRAQALADERTLLVRYEEFFRAFESLLGHELAWPDSRAFYLIVRAGSDETIEQLRRGLEATADGEVELVARQLPSGERAVLLLASAAAAEKVSRLLTSSRVEELPAPAGLGESSLLRAMPALRARLAAILTELRTVEAELGALREAELPALRALRASVHDRLLVLEARALAHTGHHLFVLEGWTPASELAKLGERARRVLGPEIVIEAVATEPWMRTDAPVELANPALFRPFEVITRLLPLPKYGTIDPTPFVAVFFPMFFGIMVGDVGLGALLALLALVIRWRSRPGSTGRAIAAVAGACAAFTVGFGFVFGELFGDLGQRALGMRQHGFDREHAVVPFLALSASLGVVHVLLGLVLAVVNAWRTGERRHALGRGVAALMVALTVMAILISLKVLPSALFTPLVVALLVAFPVLVLLEGIVAVIELMGTLGQILSYVRIMAIGTASIMLAVVANRMVGTMGSAVVGILFALLFHLINFAIGIFSPTIHALRLHYVEFFGRFFSPGGTAYRPLTHWHPSELGGTNGQGK
jgi:V/A-type H+/Na+-transporting ATPase subunit I